MMKKFLQDGLLANPICSSGQDSYFLLVSVFLNS